ncbi:YaaR family protein [Niallia taxi]|uniref:YaaR family protein n=1 Tax=Niallia taxi TaxID=2499688 RepID=UPI0015F396F8|nr:YaaR family protein [Niallia taxi]
MRINTSMNPKNIEPIRKEAAPSSAKAQFAGLVSTSRASQSQEAIKDLLQKLDKRGELLSKNITVDNLREYKRMVKQVLGEAINGGLELQEKQGLTGRGRPKTYKVVEEVDKKLVELTEQVLDKESKGMDILATIGEVKGLLVNYLL